MLENEQNSWAVDKRLIERLALIIFKKKMFNAFIWTAIYTVDRVLLDTDWM